MVSSARLRHQTLSLFFLFSFFNHIVFLILLDLIPHLLLLLLLLFDDTFRVRKKNG